MGERPPSPLGSPLMARRRRKRMSVLEGARAGARACRRGPLCPEPALPPHVWAAARRGSPSCHRADGDRRRRPHRPGGDERVGKRALHRSPPTSLIARLRRGRRHRSRGPFRVGAIRTSGSAPIELRTDPKASTSRAPAELDPQVGSRGRSRRSLERSSELRELITSAARTTSRLKQANSTERKDCAAAAPSAGPRAAEPLETLKQKTSSWTKRQGPNLACGAARGKSRRRLHVDGVATLRIAM